MQLETLTLRHFRCFTNQTLCFSPDLTLIQGGNGVGKTAILEAMLLAGLGRSCRGASISNLQQVNQESSFTVQLGFKQAPHLASQTLLISPKKGTEQLEFALFNDKISKTQVVSDFPMQYLSSSGFDWVEGSPLYRRQLIDWGCFFLYPTFKREATMFAQLLKQRNALLRQVKLDKISFRDPQLLAFTQALIQAAKQLEQHRQAYIESLTSHFHSIIGDFLPQYPHWELTYYPGWKTDLSLEQALERGWERDIFLGYTQAGPHRADLLFSVGGLPAKTHLSRGQTKLLLCALLSARAQLFYTTHGRRSVFLIDDVAAELDNSAQQRLFQSVSPQAVQWILTQIEEPDQAHWLQSGSSLIRL